MPILVVSRTKSPFWPFETPRALAIDCRSSDSPCFPRGNSEMEVADWLSGLGLPQYAKAFADNEIDVGVLQQISLPTT